MQRARIILGGEHKLRVLENRMVGNVFGPKREDVREYWRKLHNEELHVVHFLPYIFGVML